MCIRGTYLQRVFKLELRATGEGILRHADEEQLLGGLLGISGPT